MGTTEPTNEAEALETLREAYRQMTTKHRYELVFKCELAAQLSQVGFRGATLSEFRTGRHRLDVLVVGASTAAFEIKTRYDSKSRVRPQTEEYTKLFDRVYIVTERDTIKRFVADIPSSVGIWAFDGDCRFNEVRSAKSNLANLSTSHIFEVLRREEYINIIRREFGSIPNVPNTQMFRECKRLFDGLNPTWAHQYLCEALLARYLGGTANALQDAVSLAAQGRRLGTCEES